MNKVYNIQNEITSNISKFLLETFPNIRKTQLNIIPAIIFGMIQAESSVASDIAKNLKEDFSLVQHDSVVKRIKRFFSNDLFDPYSFYDNIIKHVISTYKKKHSDKRVHIIFDHMFSHDNYTVFMLSMRIGKQSIPLWFRCFEGKSNPNAFKTDLVKEGISYVSNLFDSSFHLIFLADCWFNSIPLLQHINSLGHTYCIRFKEYFKSLVYDYREKHKVWKSLNDIKAKNSKSTLLTDIQITDSKYKVNIAISKSNDVASPWIIITNGDPKSAIKDYGYRFGGIESLFKNQKSNGLYFESTVKASLKYFSSMYCMVCFTSLFLIIFGTDYTKNSNCYKKLN